MELTLPSDDDEPKDYGQFTIGQTPASSIEVGTDGATGDWWYRVKTKTLARFIDYTSCLEEEVKINFTPTGFGARIVDPCHVAMLTISTPGWGHESDGVKVGIDLSQLKRCIDKDEEHITLVVSPDGMKFLAVNDKCETSIYPLDRNMAEPRIPELDTPQTSFIIGSKEWLKACKRMYDVSDLTTLLGRDDGTVVFTTEGDYTTSRTYHLSDEMVGEPVRTQYSLDYLVTFASRFPKSKRDAITFRVEWGDSYPLLLSSIEDGNDTVDWQYFLAPRLDGEA